MQVLQRPLFFLLFFLVSLISQVEAEQIKIKVIVFDFGSVIAKTDKQQVMNFVSQSLHLSNQETEETFNRLKEHAMTGKDDHDFWIAFAKEKGQTLSDNWLKQLDQTKFEAVKEIPGMINLVKDLQKQGYQTALLSNVREKQAAIKRKHGYYDLFNPIQFSYETGIKKPDPQAYKILLDKLKLPPQSILFVDNREVNVEAAKQLGIDGVVFINREQFVRELEQRGIEMSIELNSN
ncbi:MAG: HAD family hydrolase [Parachlamydiaceae bacterium]